MLISYRIHLDLDKVSSLFIYFRYSTLYTITEFESKPSSAIPPFGLSAMEQQMNPAIADLHNRLSQGLIPDEEITRLMRSELERRLQWGYKPTHEQQLAQEMAFVKSLQKMNMQKDEILEDAHLYESPVPMSKLVYGSFIKQSCCYFKDDSMTVDEAAVAMMELYCERAQIKDGQRILDLGCGYGPFVLYVAQKYSNCHVTGLTNSKANKEYIEETCKKLNLSNVEIKLGDISKYEMEDTFDRLIAIELVEHMRNLELFLRKISKWMKKDGLLFIESMCHKTFSSICEPIHEEDWHSTYTYISGMLMIPSSSLFLYFQDDVTVTNHWILSGKHHSRTFKEWGKRLESNEDAIKSMLNNNTEEFNMSKIGLMTNSEWFGYNNGEEWMICHILFKK